jgi:hypothetical protein
MWWDGPSLSEFRSALSRNLIEVLARAFAVIQVGGLQGTGPERGRNFEQLFYGVCDRWGVSLIERAGGRSVGGQRSASGFAHEVDAATRGSQIATHWELKHLSGNPSKNDFLIFNGKGLDFLQGHEDAAVKTPLYRFFLTGTNVADECRYYAALWGISVIEPDRLPIPLLYEAVVKGGAQALSPADCQVVRDILTWGFRPLQSVITELANWCIGLPGSSSCGDSGRRSAQEVVDIQEQIGKDIFDFLDDKHPDWLDNLAETTWDELGGW